MIFYLGTHHEGWLDWLDIPLFVSRRRLMRRVVLPRALGPWALDSGGFTELSMFGAWTVSAWGYAREVQRYADEIGGMRWAAPQDWMCEPEVIARTGLDVAEHQRRTVANLLELRMLGAPVIPVLQGWVLDDYLRCRDLYAAHGVDLTREACVGVGSVCRRQHTDEAVAIFARLAAEGLALHGFGVKTEGVRRASQYLVSADSLAWSYAGRREEPLEGCTHTNCANCERFALRWRGKLLQALRVSS